MASLWWGGGTQWTGAPDLDFYLPTLHQGIGGAWATRTRPVLLLQKDGCEKIATTGRKCCWHPVWSSEGIG